MTEGWTTENLQKLFAALKRSIPNNSSKVAYSQVLKNVDWKKVAFGPFSPDECQKKWKRVLLKLRKTRTLTELIDEAEVNLSSHPDTVDEAAQSADESLPKKPPVNAYQLFCREQAPFMAEAGVPNKKYVSVWAERWRDLSQGQKTDYSVRCAKLKRKYSARMNEYLENLDEEEQVQILSKKGHKRSKMHKSFQELKRTFNGEPKIPSRSSYVLFCKDQMEHLREEFPNARKRLKKVNQMWRGLSVEEKQRYNQQLTENFRKYSVELQEWFKTLTPAEQEDYLKRNNDKSEYLDAKITQNCDKREKRCLNRPSDSEDEELSSSEEEVSQLDYDEEDENEEESDVEFDMY